MTGTAPADPTVPRRVGRDLDPGPARSALLTRGAAAAEALAAGEPHALEHLVAVAEALDHALGVEEATAADRGTGVRTPTAGLSRDELGDLLVTLSAAGLDAEERSRLALVLAARLRAVAAVP